MVARAGERHAETERTKMILVAMILRFVLGRVSGIEVVLFDER